jgi:hypothetical protein
MGAFFTKIEKTKTQQRVAEKDSRKVEFEKLLREAGFVCKITPTYNLWRLKDSVETLYVRTKDSRYECSFIGDWEAHTFKKQSYLDAFTQLNRGVSILVLLLSEKL